MKVYLMGAWIAIFVIFSFSGTAVLGQGEASSQASGAGTFEVTADRVNVRGGASLLSAVITQVNKGDRVQAIETVEAEASSEDGPRKWARVRLPEGVDVWVHGDYLSEGEVTAEPRLNVRAGPGVDHSIVGQLESGATVDRLSRKGNWVQIEPPQGAYAFIAAKFLKSSGQSATASEGSDEKPAAGDSTSEAGPDEQADSDMRKEGGGATLKQETVQEKQAIQGIDESGTVSGGLSANDVGAEGSSDTPGKVSTEVGEEMTAVESKQREADRIIRREGVVRRTTSIQAPTYYGLKSIHDGGMIDYLYSPSGEIAFKNYAGERVFVQGKEFVDRRWPKTPVLEAETVEPVRQDQP